MKYLIGALGLFAVMSILTIEVSSVYSPELKLDFNLLNSIFGKNNKGNFLSQQIKVRIKL